MTVKYGKFVSLFYSRLVISNTKGLSEILHPYLDKSNLQNKGKNKSKNKTVENKKKKKKKKKQKTHFTNEYLI